MENYDEDLNDNSFFQVLQSDHVELFTKSTEEGWVICVPRAGSVPKYALTHEDFFSHILIPSDELPESHFRTLNDREVRICNRVITVEQQDISRPYSTHILFEETFYTDDLRYKVLCVENPLEQQLHIGTGQGDNAGLITIHTLRDCIDLLWTESAGKEVLEKMDKVICDFLLNNDSLEFEPLRAQIDLVGRLYIQCLQVALHDARLRDRTCANNHLLENVKLSVETYMLHGIYKKLIKGITACTAFEDAQLNKIIRNLSDVQLRDLDVRIDLYDTVPWAKQELARVDGYSTVLGKIGCLKRMVSAISKQNTRCDVETSMGNVVAADDLLPMIVFLVIKTGLPNWVAHLTFVKQFHFSALSSCQVDEQSFLTTSLEAAIEHIKSGILIGPYAPEAQLGYESSFTNDPDEQDLQQNKNALQSDIKTSGIGHLFDQVRMGNEMGVKDIFVKTYSSETNSSDCEEDIASSSFNLCHPLCSCDKCESVLSRNLCDTTPTINSCDDRGFTALHVSCLFGRPTMVELLINHGANVDATDYSGSTPLHYAAAKGHQNALLLLVHSGATITVLDNDGNAPLHFAANNGHEGCVKALLYFAEHVGMHLDINPANTHGDTPLHHAARWGYEGIVEILLEYGACPGAENKRHQTPMDCAHNLHISRQLMRAVKNVHSILLATPHNNGYNGCLKGQDIAVAAATKPPLDFLDEQSKSVSTRDSHLKGQEENVGLRPQSTEQMKQVEKLLRAIAFGDIRLACYYVGLDGPSASRAKHVSDSSQDVTSLCHPLCVCDKCKPDVGSDDSQEDSSNVERDVLNVNVCNSDGFTPLHVASMHGRTDMVRLLLDAGARTNVCTRSKRMTPLHLACQNQRLQVSKLLLDCGDCDYDVQDLRGNTPLHYACYTGNNRLVELILKYDPLLNLRNINGKTPVEEAEEKMSLTLVQILKGGKSMCLPFSQIPD